MKYQIQFRSCRSKDSTKRNWDNPWRDYDTDIIKYNTSTAITVWSDDLDVIKMSLSFMHDHSQGMIDHRIISVIDETSAVFDPS